MNPRSPDDRTRRDTKVDAQRAPISREKNDDELITPVGMVRAKVERITTPATEAPLNEAWLRKNVSQTSTSFVDLVSRARAQYGDQLTMAQLEAFISEAFALPKKTVGRDQIEALLRGRNRSEQEEQGSRWTLPNAYILTKEGRVMFLHVDDRRGIVIVPVEKML